MSASVSDAAENVDGLVKEWRISSRLLFYSILVVSFLTLPVLVIVLALMKPHRKSQYYPFMCSILAGNFVLLSAIFCLVITENTNVVYEILPGFVICKLSAFIVNASSCFIHWTWVAMYSQRFLHVFFPLRSRRALPNKPWNVILIILISSAVMQTWAPITITELNLSDPTDTKESTMSSGTYCAEHPYFNSFSKIIVLIETTITFFLPFSLTVFADISVLISTGSWQSPFELISADDLCKTNRKDENMKIVSRLNLQSSERRRACAIKRCLISATLTLLLNFPNYLLQLIDEFYSLRDHSDISVRRLFLRADAAVYILYLLQFPLVPLNMYFLRQNITRSSRKLREKMSFQVEPSRSFQIAELSEIEKIHLTSGLLSPTAS